MTGKLYRYPGATNPDAYEQLNRCTDPDQRIEELIWTLAPIDGKSVLDIGAGSGFHAVRCAERAGHVYAAEPDEDMLEQMRTRLSQHNIHNVSVIPATAEEMPLADRAIDVAYARFAYFFGTEECLLGLREVKRILKPEGHFFIIDTNPERGTFGGIARQARPRIFHDGYTEEHMSFYAAHGFTHYVVDTVLRAPNRDVLKQILQMDFPNQYADILADLEGNEISYSLSVYHYHPSQ